VSATDAAPTPIRQRADAPRGPDHLPDTEFVVYALVQAFKTFISLAAKRWPHIR